LERRDRFMLTGARRRQVQVLHGRPTLSDRRMKAADEPVELVDEFATLRGAQTVEPDAHQDRNRGGHLFEEMILATRDAYAVCRHMPRVRRRCLQPGAAVVTPGRCWN